MNTETTYGQKTDIIMSYTGNVIFNTYDDVIRHFKPHKVQCFDGKYICIVFTFIDNTNVYFWFEFRENIVKPMLSDIDIHIFGIHGAIYNYIIR